MTFPGCPSSPDYAPYFTDTHLKNLYHSQRSTKSRLAYNRTYLYFTGIIQDIRVFKDKGYAFIRFANKESATHAIENVHNTDINGQIVKCFWGKENGGIGADSSSMQPGVVNNVQTTQYPYGYGQYWYPQGAAYPQGYMQGYAAYQYPYPAGQQYCVMPQQGQWSAQGGQQPNTPVMYAAMQKYPSQWTVLPTAACSKCLYMNTYNSDYIYIW